MTRELRRFGVNSIPSVLLLFVLSCLLGSLVMVATTMHREDTGRIRFPQKTIIVSADADGNLTTGQLDFSNITTRPLDFSRMTTDFSSITTRPPATEPETTTQFTVEPRPSRKVKRSTPVFGPRRMFDK